MKTLLKYLTIALVLSVCSFTYYYFWMRERAREPENYLENTQVITSPISTGDRIFRNANSITFEKLRRRISNQLEEMWYIVSDAYFKTEKEMPVSVQRTMKDMVELFDEIRTHSVGDLKALIDIDGAKQTRDEIAKNLSEIVQKDIRRTQNPNDCNTARKLICQVDTSYDGFGSQVHNYLYCLLTAYTTNRVLIFNGEGWKFGEKQWHAYFNHSSDSCRTNTNPVVSWNEHKESDTAVHFPVFATEWFERRHIVPREFYEQILSFHGYPYLWWMGQMNKYFYSYVPELENRLRKAIDDAGIKKPIVGVHIRRTDKLPEAKYHSIDEYMYWVELFFKRLAHTGVKIDKKRIFLATEVPEVFEKAKKKYADYEIIGQLAEKTGVKERYSDEGLLGAILDIEILSETDFLVCTISSNVCRLALEIMNHKYTDASDRYHSLDTGYIYGGMLRKVYKALISHKAKDKTELTFEIGDEILSFSVFENFNLWNGYSRGEHLKTNAIGVFPSFKVELVHHAADYHSHYGEN